jgi:hypothetical protein
LSRKQHDKKREIKTNKEKENYHYYYYYDVFYHCY